MRSPSWSLEVIAAHAMLGLEMADDGFDRGPSFHLAFDGGGGASDLTGDPGPELLRVVVMDLRHLVSDRFSISIIYRA